MKGDFKMKVGSNNTGYGYCMGQEGVGKRNDNRQRFANIWLENGLVIVGTILQHKIILRLTWVSLYGKTCSQIDNIITNQKWRRSMKDVKILRRADANSDDHLLLHRLQLKLKKTVKKNSEQLFDSSKLKDWVKFQFALKFKNKS